MLIMIQVYMLQALLMYSFRFKNWRLSFPFGLLLLLLFSPLPLSLWVMVGSKTYSPDKLKHNRRIY